MEFAVIDSLLSGSSVSARDARAPGGCDGAENVDMQTAEIQSLEQKLFILFGKVAKIVDGGK
jgi:hypothetical protein